ncbi:hypothetical protein SNL152K_2796 [Streptomyces sp. NL15-2K]|nr:hypothetical protein SNL152K_2796 [Streptomyces sp. NL15-2K]
MTPRRGVITFGTPLEPIRFPLAPKVFSSRVGPAVTEPDHCRNRAGARHDRAGIGRSRSDSGPQPSRLEPERAHPALDRTRPTLTRGAPGLDPAPRPRLDRPFVSAGS